MPTDNYFGYALYMGEREKDALEAERLRRVSAIEEINDEHQRNLAAVSADYVHRGLTQSGPHGRAIAEVQMSRAKAIIQKSIELRRATLARAPEVGTESEFASLLADLERTADVIAKSTGGTN